MRRPERRAHRSPANLWAGALLACWAWAGTPSSAHEPVQRALARAESDVQQDPDDPHAHLRRSAYRRLVGDWSGALDDLDVVVRRNPDLVETDFYLGRVLLDAGRLPEAVEALSRLLGPTAPPGVSHLRPLAFSLRARAFESLGRPGAAYDDIESAIRTAQRPGPELYTARARLLLAGALDGPGAASEQARARLAVEGLQAGLARLGGAAGLERAVLDLEEKLGRTDAALARLRRLSASAPRKDGLWERQGMLLRRAGRLADAVRAFHRARGAIDRLPSPRRWAPATLQRLERVEHALAKLAAAGIRGAAPAAGGMTPSASARPGVVRRGEEEGARAPVPASPAVVLVRGPYVQRASPTEVVLRWRTDVVSDSRVLYGPAPDQLTTTLSDGAQTSEHVLSVGGLSPATQYYYAVGSTTETLAGGDAEHFFWTAPVVGSAQPMRVWVVGDSGSANADVAAVRDAFLAYTGATRADVWLMLGDNAYASGSDGEYQTAVFDVFPTLLRNTVVWPAIGNHDALSSDSPTQSGPFFESFTLPAAGEVGGAPSGSEAYYAFDHGNVHFICLDSADSDLDPGGAMMQWLLADLDTTLQPWIVAYFHHPPYSKGSHDSDNPADSGGRLFAMREVFLPVLESYGVDLVLAGHSHAYERSVLLSGHYGTSDTLDIGTMVLDGGDGRPGGDGAYQKLQAPGTGALYVVAGSASIAGGGALNHPAMFVSLGQLGSLVLDFDGPRLDATFVDAAGATPDTFTLLKDLNLVFRDGFERGSTAAWSLSVP